MQRLIKNLLAPKLVLALAILYTATLLVLSLIRMEEIPAPNFNNADKVFHTVAYCGLMIIWYVQYFSNKKYDKNVLHKSRIFIICSLAIAFGIFIEVLQGVFTTYRTIDALDVLANTVGVSLGLIIIFLARPALRKVKNQL